jgi:hypothetical protein
MNLKRGDLVAVRVLGGEERTLRFWDVSKSGMILVTNDEEFSRLTNGLNAPWPVAFHEEEVRALELTR